VLARLRKTAGLQVEVFLPQNTEQLLERLNQILVGISQEDSRKAEGSPAPRRVLIAHDAKAIGKREMQLLARLVQDFPGANVSLVLLVDRSGIQLHERTLDSFGQRLLRWPVEAPTRAEGEALLKAARAAGFEVEVRKVLAATGFAEMKVTPKPAKDEPTKADSAQSRFEAQLALARRERRELDAAASRADDPAADSRINLDGRTEPTLDGPFAGTGATPPVPPPQPDDPVPPARSRLSSFLRWTVASVLMLLVSATVVIVLFAPKLPPHVVRSPLVQQLLPPWAIDTLASFIETPATAPAPATVPVAAADSEDKSAVNAASEHAAAGAPADAQKPAATSTDGLKSDAAPGAVAAAPKAETRAEPAKTEPSRTEAPKAEASKAEAPKEDVAKAEAQKPGAAKPEPAKSEAAKPEAAKPGVSKPELAKAEPSKPASPAEAFAPRSERGVDQMIRSAPTGSFFVQHVSLGSMAEAQDWRGQYRALSKARIVAVNTQDKGVKFAVVSGPFATRKDAETFAAREGVPPAPWLRPLKSLQAALLPAGRPWLVLGPTANWYRKVWPAERFAELALRLTAPDGALPGAGIAILGGPGDQERSMATPVLTALPQALDLVGKLDLPEVAAVLARAAIFIGNDSGLMHLAAAAGAPTLGLFGPTPSDEYGPAGPKARAVLADGAPGQGAMEDLPVARVLEAAAALLGQAAPVPA